MRFGHHQRKADLLLPSLFEKKQDCRFWRFFERRKVVAMEVKDLEAQTTRIETALERLEDKVLKAEISLGFRGLISTKDTLRLLGSPEVRILDCRWDYFDVTKARKGQEC
jgi:hypothetical protein